MLETLEDRCLPSANVVQPAMGMAPVMAATQGSVVAMQQPSGTPTPPVNTVANLTHDQIHFLQDQTQVQATVATFTLNVDLFVLGVLQRFAPQAPQFQPLIASLTSAIPAQQANVQTLQNHFNLLNQLDDVQDQAIMLNGFIQSATPVVSALQRAGAGPTANFLQNLISQDQAAVQAVQPQITALELEVSAFVP